jgi:hypothetical protein
MPTGTNGVKLYTLANQQIGIEYERGEPHVGPLAYDSKYGLSRDIEFKSHNKEAAKLTRARLAHDAERTAGMRMNNPTPEEEIEQMHGQVLAYCKACMAAEDYENVEAILNGQNVEMPALDRQALDEAVAKAGRKTEARVHAQFRAIREAERNVRPWIGDIGLPQQSAEAVYRLALDKMGVPEANSLHPDALWPVLKMQPKPGEQRRPSPRMAVDVAGAAEVDAEFLRMFPNANRLKHS